MKAKLRRLLHRLFFAVLAVGTLTAFFYAEENWRGARAWAATRREFTARGESLDLKTLISRSVPDDQNLAMAPLFVRALRYQPDPANGVLTFAPDKPGPNKHSDNPVLEELSSMYYGPNPPPDSNPARSNARWTNGHRRDLRAWQRSYRQNDALPHTPQPQTPAADVLLALSRFAPALDELAQAAAMRPSTRFPVNWTLRPPTKINFLHQNLLRVMVFTLSLRSSARLAAGETAPARQDLSLALRLTNDLSREPVLISAVNQAYWVDALLQPFWEGLEARQWSAADLAALQEQLGRLDLVRSFRDALHLERAAFFVQTMEDFENPAYVRQWLPEFLGRSSDDPPDTFWKAVRYTLRIPDSPRRVLWSLLPYAPRGWLLQNTAFGCRLWQSELLDAIDVDKGTIHLEEVSTVEQKRQRLPLRPSNFLARNLLPVFDAFCGRVALAQATLNEAITACALERYFLDHGDYPVSLAELVPVYLDRVRVDPVDGAPLRYRRTVDGRFLLYSLGANLRDDGGSLEWLPNRAWRRGDSIYAAKGTYGLPRQDPSKGDVIWQYTPAEPPDLPANTYRLEARP